MSESDFIGQEVYNSPLSNYKPAVKVINGKEYQGIILCDSSGNEIGILPISGTVAVSGLVSASSGTTNPTGSETGVYVRNITNPKTATGTLTASAQSVSIDLSGSSYDCITVFIGGTFSGSSTLEVEGLVYGDSTYRALSFRNFASPATGGITTIDVAGGVRAIIGSGGGVSSFRIRCSAFQAGDSISVKIAAYQISSEVVIETFLDLIRGQQTDGTQLTQIVDPSSLVGVAVSASGELSLTELPGVTSPSDVITNTATTKLMAQNMLWNGTNWSRWYQAANALNTTGTGVPNAALVAQFDDVSPTAITENQFGHARMSANRNQYMTLRDAAGNERGQNVNANNAALIAIDQTTAGTTNGTQSKIWDGTNISVVEAAATYSNGLTATNKGLTVNARQSQVWDSSHPDNAGAGADGKLYGFNQDSNGNSLVCLSSIRGKLLRFANQIGTTISGTNPPSLPLGGYAATGNPTAATAGRAVDVLLDKLGRPVVAIGQMRENILEANITITSSTTETTLISAVASTFCDVTTLTVSNTSATAVRVDIRDATGGTVRKSVYVPAGDERGVSLPRVWTQTSSNNNWTAQCSASVSDVRIFAQYEKNL